MEASKLFEQIEGVRFRMAKMIFEGDDKEICKEVYERAKNKIKDASRSFLPVGKDDYGSIDVLGMCCTSLSFTLGPEVVHEELSKGYPSASNVTDMASATVNAIKTVTNHQDEKSRIKIALLTPYIDQIHDLNVKFLAQNGIDAIVSYNLGLTVDNETSQVEPESISNYCKVLASEESKEVQAIFIGCSAFRAMGYKFIENLENEIGIPVITSNQAMIW